MCIWDWAKSDEPAVTLKITGELQVYIIRSYRYNLRIGNFIL